MVVPDVALSSRVIVIVAGAADVGAVIECEPNPGRR
jgi:hypothetical protein